MWRGRYTGRFHRLAKRRGVNKVVQVCSQINDGMRRTTLAARCKAISRLINRRPTRALIILLCFDMDSAGSVVPDANEGLVECRV